ncbi:cobaltochelatase subunit CobN [Halalkaliarchaeum sp. AArc-CO]|uniref:cobaltochelatase subunit CobN n=1 Tax=Halalkaliarchaeum sp. AArc-CO TaxID=2866381 RepID=UPI00217E88E7|nr:cobaltochelatase subunit CobN [Halalkaliarchaeum sp. AArc-CO]
MVTTIGLYTATENELGAVGEAADRLAAGGHGEIREDTASIRLSVRSKGDLREETDISAFLAELESVDAAVFWLHGGPESMPGYDRAVERLTRAGVPLVVVSTGGGTDTESVGDATVADADRERVAAYLERGGVVNVENCCRYLASEYGDYEGGYDDPVELPTEGVYHPDYPGVTYEELCELHDSGAPTVGIWFYESHWIHANTGFVDALVRRLEALGTNVLPAFCVPVAGEEDRKDAEWVARNWFSGVDAVISTFVFSLAMNERGRDAIEPGGEDGSRAASELEELFLRELGVPVLQAMTTKRSREAYADADTGVLGFELALSVALPEFDGPIVTHPISGNEPVDVEAGIGTQPRRHLPIENRIDHLARLALNWARLRHLPNRDKKIAVVLHNYPPSDDGIGTAFGLDTPESVVNLLREFDRRGYDVGTVPEDGAAVPEDGAAVSEGRTGVPEDGAAVIDRLTAQLTLDGRWIDPDDVREASVDVVSPDRYRTWFDGLDGRLQERVREEWGEPPDRPIAIPGCEYGNVLVTVQPPRGFGMDPSKVYHDADLQPPHEYVAFYRWLRESYGADAVVHLGTHGSLEWLPGKTVGLDGASAPDALIDDLPNVYPYVINNPGEGTQAKRRSYAAIVDHLTPPMREAGTYDDLTELEELAREYREAGTEREGPLADLVRERVTELDLGTELGIGHGAGPDTVEEVPIDDLVESIHEYLTDVKTTQIRMGLHTLGEPPAGERFVEYLVALTRMENPGAPSLHRSVADALGLDYDRLRDSPGAYDERLEMYCSEAIDFVGEVATELVEELARTEFDTATTEFDTATTEFDIGRVGRNLDPSPCDLGLDCPDPSEHDDLRTVLEYVCEEAVPRVRGASAEIPRIADALDGGYVPPGGSGAPTRGGVDLLPTGRNFYTLDPRKVPARPAWEVGREVAEGVLERHRDEHGEYPEEIGVVAWGTPTVRTRGETIAQVLAAMGVEPVWTDAGRIEGVEPIPLSELDRPRVDVTTRVSGLFRDAFPAAASVIHEAIDTVADLEEPHDRNYVKKHVEEDTATYKQEGHDAGTAREAAVRRVFTTAPGGYGAGTNKVLDEADWDDRSDLARAFLQWGGYALDEDGEVTEAHDTFERRLGGIDATVKLEDTDEQDEFDSSDWYAFHGGLVAAVGEVSGSDPASYVGDSSDPGDVRVYTNEQKVRKSMRTRVLNPDWLESMEEHGYKGAGDLATTVEVTLGWDATADVVSDTLWENVAEEYAFDEDRREWMREVNPWALSSITATLLEAIDRELWDADPETEDRLRDLNLSVEGDLEARATDAELSRH